MSNKISHNHSLSTKKKTILVTGSNGQLGKTFRKLEEEYPCFNFVFSDSNAMDITDFKSVKKNFESVQPNYCINCAAYTNVEMAEVEPEKAFLINAEAVLNLAQTCKKYHTILVHISTDYVFDGQKRAPYTINDIPNPINVYGVSKLKGEQYIQEVLKEFFIIRTSWLYCKEYGKNFYRTILSLAKENKKLRITDAQIGCPTETVNLARFILGLIKSKEVRFGIYHFSDKEIMTWYDFAIQILKENSITNVKIIKDKNYKTKAKRPLYSILAS